MVIDIKEASELLEFVKGMTPEVEEGIVEKMVFKGVVPEGKSSVEYLKELREKEYDYYLFQGCGYSLQYLCHCLLYTREGFYYMRI